MKRIDNQPRSEVRWPSSVAASLLVPQQELVPLLMPIDGPESPPLAWRRNSSEFYPLPGLGRLPPTSRDVLASMGRQLVFEREALDDDESINYLHRHRSLGIYSFSFATGVIDRSSYEPRPGWQNRHSFAGSPDGDRVVVAQSWVAPEEMSSEPSWSRGRAYGTARTTVSIGSFTGEPARELFTLRGGWADGRDDVALQWSPDGSAIAFCALRYDGLPKGFTKSLTILDAATGDEVLVIDHCGLVGSAPWSPDSTRLLVVDDSEMVWILEVSSGNRHPVPFLRGPRPDVSVSDSPRLLGFCDLDRVLVATQCGTLLTISRVEMITGATETMISCPTVSEALPVLAQMPSGYWD